MSGPELNYGAIAPIAFCGVGAMVVLLGEVLLSGCRTVLGRPVTEAWLGSMLALVSVFFLLLALATSWQAFQVGTSLPFEPGRPTLLLDPLASFSIGLLAVGALLSCLLSVGYLVELRINHGEYYALVLLATSGMMVLVSAADLITLFLGLEIMSIPIYVLAGFDRRRLRSNESALKYYLVGSFASALLLYGMALLYGVSGHTDFEGIRAALSGEGAGATSPLGVVGVGLVLVGFTFKISSVPFHQWTPDVYEGAPTSVTAYMSVTVKVAAFVALLRVVVAAFGGVDARLEDALWVLAALTMVIGNVTAVVQENVKRMLAYSSIAHAGYVLIGFVAGTREAYAAVLFYLLVYVFMNLGAFAVIVALARGGEDRDRFDDYTGLARSRPGLAAAMTLFMLALAGIPGTAGFVAKFTVFAAAVRSDHVPLTVLAVLTSLVSVYYYLRLPVLMYMREPREGEAEPESRLLPSGEWLVLAACAAVTLLLGLFPNAGPTALLGWIRALDWSRSSVALLF
jgi:NADH-quinone oxidoreductase subunit N